MDRRLFLRSSVVTGLSALLAVPGLPSTEGTSAETGIETLQVNHEIRSLEAYLREHPGTFSWQVHNELRHQYLAFSEAEAMKHADIILANSVMDSYILNTLSDWHAEKDPGMAVVALLGKVQRNPSLPHLWTASLIKAGDICKVNNLPEQARRLYQAAIPAGAADMLQSLKPYAILVDFRLQQ